MTSPDRPETPTSAADMLERTRLRARQLRRRRRGMVAAAAAVVLAAGISVPIVLADNTGRSQSVQVVGVPSTLGARPGRTGPPAPSTTAWTPSTTTPSSATSPPTPTPTPTSTSTSTTPAVTPCATRDLRAHLVGLGAAAGSAGFDLVLVNTGLRTCTLGGYPGVSYVTAATGTIVGAPAQRNDLGTATTIVLAPGRAADAMLTEVDSLNYPTGTCRLTNAAGLRVYPPNETVALFVAQAVRACANRADPVLSIGPLRAS